MGIQNQEHAKESNACQQYNSVQCGGLALVLPTVDHEISGRQFDHVIDTTLDVLHHTDQIAPCDVGLNNDPPLTVFTIYDVRPQGLFYGRQQVERHISASRNFYWKLTNGIRRCPRIVVKPCDEIIGANAVYDLPHFTPVQSQLCIRRDVCNSEATVENLLTINPDVKLTGQNLLFNTEVNDPVYTFDLPFD